jgi:hypothetical protein
MIREPYCATGPTRHWPADWRNAMATFEILLGLMAFCVLLAIVAQHLDLPVAIPLVLGGMGSNS